MSSKVSFPDAGLGCWYCILEALQNVQKYAAASAVQVRVREDGGEVRVEVIDDGRGFDVGTVERGAGLTNMEDRLDALGGNLQIESTLGGGTTLHATVPVPHLVLAPS
jgi:signal transduction histidine kinase